jgi:segregation and condensation protein A
LSDTPKDISPADAAAAPGSDQDEFSALGDTVRLKLEKFEGPFEVLLYLIRTQEIDIFDIPIVTVTEQYLGFLELMHEENLDVAGEFLVMAATLIQIKSKMILPADVAEDEEEIEEEDPRLELVEKLLEYRKFRDLAERMGDRMETAGDWYGRRVKPSYERDEDEEEFIEVSLYDLIRAIRGILRYITAGPFHEVHAEGASVDEKIAYIADQLATRESVTWSDLWDSCKTRVEIVCCLLAILELCRMGRIRVHQHRSYGDIRIFARTPDEPSPAAVPDVVAV